MDIKPQFEMTTNILQGLKTLYPQYGAISNQIQLLKRLPFSEENSYISYIEDLVNIIGPSSNIEVSLSLHEIRDLAFERSPYFTVMKVLSQIEKEKPELTTIKSLKKMYVQFEDKTNDIHVYRYLSEMTGLRLVNNLAAIRNKVSIPDLHECFSQGQIKSKQWLVSEINKASLSYDQIQLLCGWYALHGFLLAKPGLKIHSYDIDPVATRVSSILNQDSPNYSETFTAETKNIYDISEYPKGSLIINTSCEHLSDFNLWYKNVPEGSQLALQSNNFFDCPTHTNCVKDLEDFKKQVNLSKVYYAGELELPEYTRFMLIGVK